MKVLIDTSAFYALLDRDDENHEPAKRAWAEIMHEEYELVASNYVVVETLALLNSRIGANAARGFQEELVPVIHVECVTPDLHRLAVTALFAVSKHQLSLVDCVSFELMRALGIRTAFTFDAHFVGHGFDIIP
jgi:uncharacterized protein